MAKGLTNQPLTIWVAAEWYSRPAVLKLMSEGHRVVRMQQDAAGLYAWSGPEPNLILHPAAHFFNETMFDYLPAAITAARRRQREGRRETK